MFRVIHRLFLTFFIFGGTVLYAQELDSADQTSDTLIVIDSVTSDTLIFQPITDSAISLQVTNPINFEKHLNQNPTLALFKSLAIPGLGQIGNRSYMKAAFIIGVESWFLTKALDNGSKASDLRKQRDAEPDLSTRLLLNSEFEKYRDQRNKFIWFTGITIFISMFDAFVDAHLSGRPEEHIDKDFDLSMNQFDDGISANLTFSF